MNYKCLGCGITLQDVDSKKIGYTNNIEAKYCERCFRIKHYNEYQKIDIDINDFYNIIDKINETNDLVVLVIDIINISSELKKLVAKLKRKPLLVISKRDIISYKISDNKISSLITIQSYDKVVISSNKNYNLDLLIDKINTYKKSKNVYVVGLTNSGKSTLINKIIYNYTNLELNITTSMLPSTTLDTLKIKINDNLNLIDTPGIIDTGNICNYLSIENLKKVLIKKEIRPITYQIKEPQYLMINDFLKIDCLENCSLTIYISNQLEIKRYFKDFDCNLAKKEFAITKKGYLVINGLGFIYVNKPTKLNIYTYDKVEIYFGNI